MTLQSAITIKIHMLSLNYKTIDTTKTCLTVKNKAIRGRISMTVVC